MSERITLYKHQKECLEEMIQRFKKEDTICLSWYTGAGKTNIFIELCRRMIEKNPNIKIGISAYLISDIRDQIMNRVEALGLKDKAFKITYDRNTKVIPDRNIYVFNPQTLFKRELDFKFDVLIIDEAHVGLNESTIMIRKIQKTMCKKDCKTLLVTATPWDVLALKQYKDITVLKRPLDVGLKDGLLTDFHLRCEEAQIEFKPEDFSRYGDLMAPAAVRNMTVLKSACIGKMQYLLKNYDKQLGNKVLVICPPGNLSEVAATLKNTFGGLMALQLQHNSNFSMLAHWENTEENITRFKEDPSIRFLFVVNKCSVGFDMKDLTSVVDLTMTRNIKVLAQRTGRIARDNNGVKKSYFYVYDKSLVHDRLDWLIATLIDFTLGHYEGWTTKRAYWRPVVIHNQWSYIHASEVPISEIIRALKNNGGVENSRTLKYMNDARPPTRWTLELAVTKMNEYSSRTEMWDKNPSLYKWFRLNSKETMDKHFPFKTANGMWTKDVVVAAMKTVKSREEFKIKYPGASYFLEKMSSKDRMTFKDKYLPPAKNIRWDDDRVLDLFKKIDDWGDIRLASGARSYIVRAGGTLWWRHIFCKMKGLPLPKKKALFVTKKRAPKARDKERERYLNRKVRYENVTGFAKINKLRKMRKGA